MARVLGIRLSGPREYESTIREEPWIGDGSNAEPADIARALSVFVRACVLLFLLVAGGAIISIFPA